MKHMQFPPQETLKTAVNPIPALTSGRLLARSTLWNLLGQLLPMAVALVTVPPLVRGLGIERFGLLSLAWVVIGYFSLFDLGMGRALTKVVAEKLGSNEMHLIPSLAWTSLLLMLLLGVAGSLLTITGTPFLVRSVLKVPVWLQTETLTGFYWLGISIPLVTVTSGLRGILEAQQRFRILALIRIPTSIFSFVGPCLVLPFSHSLAAVIIVLIVGRLIGAAVHLVACFNALPAFRESIALDLSVVSPVIRLGGWMTISNIVSPFMVYMDRFLIGALLSVGAVAYYTAPFDVVIRLSIIPAALSGVLFPAFAVSLLQDRSQTALLHRRGIKYISLALFPIVFAVVTFAPEGLRMWLGSDFSEKSTPVLRWLTAGVFINCLAHVPFGFIQSAGRADFTAKLHLVELPMYLAVLWMFTGRFGINGTALAWFTRVTVDAVVLCCFAHRLLPEKPSFRSKLLFGTLCGLVSLWVATIPRSVTTRAFIFWLGMGLFAWAGWHWAMGSEERALFLTWRRRARMVSTVQGEQ